MKPLAERLRPTTLDSLRYVKTVPINITNFNDTVVKTVALEKMKGVKIVPCLR